MAKDDDQPEGGYRYNRRPRDPRYHLSGDWGASPVHVPGPNDARLWDDMHNHHHNSHTPTRRLRGREMDANDVAFDGYERKPARRRDIRSAAQEGHPPQPAVLPASAALAATASYFATPTATPTAAAIHVASSSSPIATYADTIVGATVIILSLLVILLTLLSLERRRRARASALDMLESQTPSSKRSSLAGSKRSSSSGLKPLPRPLSRQSSAFGPKGTDATTASSKPVAPMEKAASGVMAKIKSGTKNILAGFGHDDEKHEKEERAARRASIAPAVTKAGKQMSEGSIEDGSRRSSRSDYRKSRSSTSFANEKESKRESVRVVEADDEEEGEEDATRRGSSGDEDHEEMVEQEESPRDRKRNSSSASAVVKFKPTPPAKLREEILSIAAALRNLKKEDVAVIHLLSQKTAQQLAELVVACKENVGRGLVELVTFETSGHVRRLIKGMVTDPIEYDADALEEAMKGIGCNEAELIEILVDRTNADIEAIKMCYERKYKKNLEQTVQGEVKGYLRALFTIVLQASRDEGDGTSDVAADVEALYAAGVGRPGTDEMAFITLLMQKNCVHLRKVFVEYKVKYGDTMCAVVRKEFKGDLETAILGLVMSIENKPHYVATLFEKSMKGIGHDAGRLVRLATRYRNKDFMRMVKMEYLLAYDTTLFSRIQKETTGLYQKCLLELIQP
ncbi:hypothetical protein HK101_007669 [Irineochytrium annulatum]|nr:hypothetical protein HK101_007669 [Irineochytrium annulatum]